MIRFELTNYKYIVLRKSRTYWVGHDHTVWFLEKLFQLGNKNRKLRYDEGFKRNVRSVAFHTANFPKIRETLLGAKLKAVPAGDDLIVFMLPKAVDKKQVKEWEQNEEAKLQDVESVLFPDRLRDREVVKHFIECGAQIVSNIRHHMPPELRESLGREMLAAHARMAGCYLRMELEPMTESETQEAARQLLVDAQALSLLLMTAFNAGALGVKPAVKIGQSLHEIMRAIHKRIL